MILACRTHCNFELPVEFTDKMVVNVSKNPSKAQLASINAQQMADLSNSSWIKGGRQVRVHCSLGR